MKKVIITALAIVTSVIVNTSCNNNSKDSETKKEMKPISEVFEQYYKERMRLFPLEATANGDNSYNDLLPIDISDAYRDTLKVFYQKYLTMVDEYANDSLSVNDKMSYEILKWDMQLGIDGLKFSDNLIPFQQFWGMPLTFGQLGSGQSMQPFKTVKDYHNFLGRINGFEAWCDTAISNMKRGIAQKFVLPKALVVKMIPQMKAMLVKDVKQSIFYMPITNFPADFTDADKKEIETLYTTAIEKQIIPSYQKLADFLENDYLPNARTTTGISEVPNGKDYYQYLIRLWTTTNLTADEVFEIGQQEVKNLRAEMEKIKEEVGFKGDLKAFFKYLNTDKKFMPFTTEKEVIDAHNAVYTKMQPQLMKLFSLVPKCPFEIRQTEKFREASASAEYNPGTPDGSRPGIFYVPIPNPKKFNTFGMESLFLHEAIPGHHYQISLQQENTSLPEFRRHNWYGAYGEGWALYTESLGKELGLYTDAIQHFGALSGEMHRSIRLVVDAGMHTKGWTREQAIAFSLENEGESEESVTAEIERYMAIPGQALSYKIGQLKIRELRKKAQDALGDKFSITKFHDVILNDGCLPIAVLEAKMDRWMNAK